MVPGARFGHISRTVPSHIPGVSSPLCPFSPVQFTAWYRGRGRDAGIPASWDHARRVRAAASRGPGMRLAADDACQSQEIEVFPEVFPEVIAIAGDQDSQ